MPRLGHPAVVPAVAIDRSRPFVSMSCSRCHPRWQIDDLQLDRPPWSATPINPVTERYRYPGCGSPSPSSTVATAAERRSEATW
jgi:hypothetical protein